MSALEHPGRAGSFPLRAHRARQRPARAGQGHRSEDVFAADSPEPAAPGYFRYLQTRARLRAALQHPEDALEDLFACGRLEQEWDIRTPAFGSWRADAAPLLASLGRQRRGARAGPRGARALPRLRRTGSARRFAAHARPRRAGRRRDRAARAIGRPARAVVEAARATRIALLELGAATRRAGRRADARKPLREALELARACGADAVAVRAHDELVTAGARPRRDPTESRSTLTASELRVARMAADGMTNREIAQSALPDREHDRDAPPQRLPQARHPLALAARSRPLAAPGASHLTEFLTGAP